MPSALGAAPGEDDAVPGPDTDVLERRVWLRGLHGVVELAVGARDAEDPAVQVRELRALDRLLATRNDVAVRPQSEHAGGELLAALANASLHVGRGDRQRSAVVVTAADHQVDVRVVGVVVL